MSIITETAKALKSSNSQPAPKTLKQSIFQKPITWIVVAGVAIIVGSKLYKKYLKNPLAEEKRDINVLTTQGQKPTYLDSNYKQFADAIYSARSGSNLFGTNEQAIYDVFKKMKNDLDIVKLIEAFGTRRFSYSLMDGNLGGYLTDELDEDELNIINTDLNSKGIKYKF